MCADNWLAALRAAREQLGESGGVPPGASCVVAESGEVTILDAANRRRYTLTPASLADDAAAPRRPPPRPSRAPEPVREASPAELAAKAAAALENGLEPTLAASSAALEGAPPSLGAQLDAPPTSGIEPAGAAGAAQEEDRASPRHAQTLAYSPQRADALRREYEGARARASVGSSRPEDARSASSSRPDEARAVVGSRSEPPRAGAAAAEAPRAAVGSRADDPRPSTMPPANDASARSNLRALPPVPRASVSSIPPAKFDRPASPRTTRPPRHGASEARLVPAFQRDVEPTPRSPITYRERAYLVTPPDDLSNLEALLQAELLQLRGELAQAPRGQLIHLAAFDKPFRGAPNEPPVATLEWSDWRGNAVFVSNAELAPAAPAAGDIPAPGSHVSPIPRAPAPRPAEPAFAPTEPAFAPTELPPPAQASASVEPPAQPASTPPLSSLASSLPPRASSPSARPSSVPASKGKSPWDKLRAAAAPEAQDARTSENPASSERALPPQPEVAALPPAPSAPPPVAPALPWLSAPLPPPAPAGAELPPAFQAPANEVRTAEPPAFREPQKAARDDTGEVDNRLAQAFEALPDLYFLPTPVAGIEFATQLISRIVPCEAISVCLYDINTDEFRFVAVGGPGADKRRASAVPSQAGLFGAAKWTVEDALIVSDVAQDKRYQPAIDGRDDLELLNLAYVPLRKSNQLLGMVQLINRAGDRGFTKSDVAVLHYIATQLGDFISTRRSLD